MLVKVKSGNCIDNWENGNIFKERLFDINSGYEYMRAVNRKYSTEEFGKGGRS